MPESMSLERRRLLKALRRRGRPDARRRGHDRRDRARPRSCSTSTPDCVHAAAVQEPGQPRDPPQDHRRGDLARHRRQGRHPRLRRRHRRHDHRRRRGHQGSASRRFKAIAVEPVTSPVITQTMQGQPIKPGRHKIQGIGAGFIPDVLNIEHHRRGDPGQRRRRLRDGPAAGTRGGHARAASAAARRSHAAVAGRRSGPRTPAS